MSLSHASSTLHDHSSADCHSSEASLYRADIEKQSPQLHRSMQRYQGTGTPSDPFIVDWDLDDPEDPYNWTKPQKWLITMQVCLPPFVLFDLNVERSASWPSALGLFRSAAAHTAVGWNTPCASLGYLMNLPFRVYRYTFWDSHWGTL